MTSKRAYLEMTQDFLFYCQNLSTLVRYKKTTTKGKVQKNKNEFFSAYPPLFISFFFLVSKKPKKKNEIFFGLPPPVHFVFFFFCKMNIFFFWPNPPPPQMKHVSFYFLFFILHLPLITGLNLECSLQPLYWCE